MPPLHASAKSPPPGFKPITPDSPDVRPGGFTNSLLPRAIQNLPGPVLASPTAATPAALVLQANSSTAVQGSSVSAAAQLNSPADTQSLSPVQRQPNRALAAPAAKPTVMQQNRAVALQSNSPTARKTSRPPGNAPKGGQHTPVRSPIKRASPSIRQQPQLGWNHDLIVQYQDPVSIKHQERMLRNDKPFELFADARHVRTPAALSWREVKKIRANKTGSPTAKPEVCVSC